MARVLMSVGCPSQRASANSEHTNTMTTSRLLALDRRAISSIASLRVFVFDQRVSRELVFWWFFFFCSKTQNKHCRRIHFRFGKFNWTTCTLHSAESPFPAQAHSSRYIHLHVGRYPPLASTTPQVRYDDKLRRLTGEVHVQLLKPLAGLQSPWTRATSPSRLRPSSASCTACSMTLVSPAMSAIRVRQR